MKKILSFLAIFAMASPFVQPLPLNDGYNYDIEIALTDDYMETIDAMLIFKISYNKSDFFLHNSYFE